MSIFDPTSFMDMQLTDANSTQAVPVPAGEYVAIIDKIEPRQWTSKADPSKSGVALDVTWSVDDEAVKQFLERDKVTVRQGLMLDMNDEGSGLDMGKGKNVSLGRLRDAVGKNQPGVPFAFSQLVGQPARIIVAHRTDDRNPDVVYAEVKGVAKL
jgi:hypothetical protein